MSALLSGNEWDTRFGACLARDGAKLSTGCIVIVMGATVMSSIVYFSEEYRQSVF